MTEHSPWQYQDNMNNEKPQKQREREAREARKAQALRDNLRRRKTAVKNRKTEK